MASIVEAKGLCKDFIGNLAADHVNMIVIKEIFMG